MDLDQKAQICWESDLIACVRNKSDGPGALGARAAAERTEPNGARGSSPEFTKSGTPGVGLSRGWAVEDARGTCSPPGVLVRFGEVRSTDFGGHGGSGRRGFAGVRRSKGSRGYGLYILAQKEPGIVAGAHRARKRRCWPGEVSGGVVRRRGMDWCSRNGPAG